MNGYTKLTEKTNLWLQKERGKGNEYIRSMGLADTNYYI